MLPRVAAPEPEPQVPRRQRLPSGIYKPLPCRLSYEVPRPGRFLSGEGSRSAGTVPAHPGPLRMTPCLNPCKKA